MLVRPLPNVVWNLFLAVIPVVLAAVLFAGIRSDRRNGRVRWMLWIPVMLAWLLFLPNTCYLVTEWRHFLETLLQSPHLYFDASSNVDYFIGLASSSAFYVFYTGSGLICFYLSIYPLDRLFRPPWFVRPFFFFLCSLGVYLGLIDRYNSWTIVRHWPEIFASTHHALTRPFLLITLCGFAIILWAFYGVFGLTMDGARLRYRKFRPA